MRKLFILMFLVLAADGAVANAEELSAQEMAAARKIYITKCAKCHVFYEPKKYSESDWQVWMEKMNKKSKLKREQATLLGRYLDEYRAGGLPGKPQWGAKPGQGGSEKP